MRDNTKIIAAIKDADNALTKALNTLKEIASELPQNNKKPKPIELTCTCLMCEISRSGKKDFWH